MGFGPEVAGFNDRHGTRWKISLIPLGGYVKFFGDDNEASVPDPAVLAAMSEEERKRSFFGQSVGRRAAVVVAGPLTNFILAIVVFAGVFMVFGKPTAIPRVAGGHLLFYTIEAARGRPLSERAQEVGFRIGLAIVLMLMIFAAFNDLRPFITGS